ncbi:hypothetical protein J1N35_043162 [Gossypium stocksii]|uniref:Uncharacterized protein n=1 Tax=Gossypium stocksii TaxID=47602 RepID=A0A9D3U6V9_9ROSI|nr:hypothetical protein J1N35_043162 [Gossypium stocksii]
MARTRGSNRAISENPSRHNGVGSALEAQEYVCTTKLEEMNQILAVRRIRTLNFSYDFSILIGAHRLSNTSNSSFLLPLHILELGFHLPLHPFFYHLFDDYRIAPNQLSSFS